MILLIKKAPGPLKARELLSGFPIGDPDNNHFAITIKKVGMALRHSRSRNRKGISIITRYQEKAIGETLIFDFEKDDFVLRKILGHLKNSLYDLFLSFPRKRESIKINYMDSPIKSGNDKKMNTERYP